MFLIDEMFYYFHKKIWMCCVDIEYLLMLGQVYNVTACIMEKQVLHAL